MPVNNNQVSPIQTRNYQYALSNQNNIQPNAYRNKFNAFNRQVEENQPGQINMSFVDRSKSAAEADIASKKQAGAETVGKMGPDISTFLPTFQKSMGDDVAARQATAANLKAYLPEYKPAEIDTAMEDEAMNLLNQQNRAGYLTALMEGRGGGLSGANRLDAAILDRSGAGRQMFEQGRQKLAGYTDVGNAAEAELAKMYEDKKSQLKTAQDRLIDAINKERLGLTEKGEGVMASQSRVMPWADIEAVKEEARKVNPALPIFDLKDYAPFLDRNVSFEESLSGPEADQYNYLAELLGRSPTLFRKQDPLVNREALLRAFLAQGTEEKNKADEIQRKAEAAWKAQESKPSRPMDENIGKAVEQAKKEKPKDKKNIIQRGISEGKKAIGSLIGR